MAESRIIETKRLTIFPFSDKFITNEYVGWLNNPEIVRFSEQRHKNHSIESCKDYWLTFSGTLNYFWAITLKNKGYEHIGNINAYVDEPNKTADIGILIGEKTLWSCGFGLEAWNVICLFLINEIHIRKITAGTMSSNTGMIRIFTKSGMIEDGRRLRQCILDGKEVDVSYYALFA